MCYGRACPGHPRGSDDKTSSQRSCPSSKIDETRCFRCAASLPILEKHSRVDGRDTKKKASGHDDVGLKTRPAPAGYKR